jgi:hypothetical protein
VWLLDQKINQRGVRLDTHYIAQAQKICDDAAKPLKIEFDKITDGITPTQDAKFKAWLIKNGCPFPTDENGEPTINLQKETINKLLGERDEDEEDSLADDYEAGQDQGLHTRCHIHVVGPSASVKSWAPQHLETQIYAGVLRLRWKGPMAPTISRRWPWSMGRAVATASELSRPTLKISTGFNDKGEETFAGHDVEQLVAAILTGDHEHVRMMFGEPIEAVANGLRHALIPDPGNVFEVGDFMQVEARIVLGMAGQHDKTALMAAGHVALHPDGGEHLQAQGGQAR